MSSWHCFLTRLIIFLLKSAKITQSTTSIHILNVGKGYTKLFFLAQENWLTECKNWRLDEVNSRVICNSTLGKMTLDSPGYIIQILLSRFNIHYVIFCDLRFRTHTVKRQQLKLILLTRRYLNVLTEILTSEIELRVSLVQRLATSDHSRNWKKYQSSFSVSYTHLTLPTILLV